MPSNDIITGKLPPHVGICENCKQEFRCRYKGRKFCSMSCYIKSDGFQERIRATCKDVNRRKRIAVGVESPDERIIKQCLQCQTDMYVRPKTMESKKFCSSGCYRKHFAERFDRWVANPQSIALPQCYDEFLTQSELPCLVDGCDWIGENLGNHVNFAHGITAAQFKELAGFNRNTGLVPPHIAAKLAQGKAEMVKRLGIKPPEHKPCFFASGKGVRLEGKEHLVKAQALLRAEIRENPKSDTDCPVCGKQVLQVTVPPQTYCSVRCRSKAHYKKVFALTCCQCGCEFLGDRLQWKRSKKGREVCCSITCRNARATTMTVHYQKKRIDRQIPPA